MAYVLDKYHLIGLMPVGYTTHARRGNFDFHGNGIVFFYSFALVLNKSQNTNQTKKNVKID